MKTDTLIVTRRPQSRGELRRRQSAGLSRLYDPVPDAWMRWKAAAERTACPARPITAATARRHQFALEEAVAALDGGYRSIAVGSGHGRDHRGAPAPSSRPATTCWWSTASTARRAGSATRVLARFGVTTTFYDPADRRRHRRADPPQHAGRLPRKPRLPHLRDAGRAGHRRGGASAPASSTIIDNTWATPLYFQPLAHGVDVVDPWPRPNISAAIPT